MIQIYFYNINVAYKKIHLIAASAQLLKESLSVIHV